MTETDDTFMLEYQKRFVVWLTSLDDTDGAESLIAPLVKPQYRHRLNTYQASYLGRITSNLSDTLFEACESLFGREFVAQILAGFFKSHPPASPALTSAAEGLPDLLRGSNSSREAFLFADLLELSQMRWNILINEDPPQIDSLASTPLNALFLNKTVRLISPSAHHDLAEAWSVAQLKNVQQIPESLFSKKRSVLLGKSSPLHFHVVGVEYELEAFVRALSQGASVEQAVDCLEQEITQDSRPVSPSLLEQLLQEFLHTLSQLNFISTHEMRK